MRLRGGKRHFQDGGFNPAVTPAMMQAPGAPAGGALSPQQQQAMQQFARQRMGGAGMGAPMGSAPPAGGANPLAQQLAARGAMPTPAAGAGPASTLGAAPAGGMMPPGAGGVPGAAGPAAMGNFQPRPGMGGLPGAGAPQGMSPAAMPGGAPPPSLQGAPPAGAMPGAPGAGAAPTPQQLAMAQQARQQVLAANPGLAGAGMGFAKGGRVVKQKGMTTGPTKQSANKIAPQQGMTTGPVPKSANKLVGQKGTGGKIKRTSANTFDSTKPAPGNLPTSQAGHDKFAKGGSVPNSFDSLRSVGDNLPLQKQSEPLMKKAKGGRMVLHRKPPGSHKRRLAEDRRSPAPVPDDSDDTPTYDTPRAGADGWPPTPNFTSAPGPNVPQPVPAATPISPTPAGPPGMAKGGEVHGRNCKCADCAKRVGGAIKKAKGGECDKMAAGGAAKQRRGFPNTIPHTGKLKLAKGGSVRGSGAAERGTHFSGIY